MRVVVVDKDVVLAVLGTSAGLAGILLVFVGLVLGTLGSYDATTPKSVLVPYKRMIAFDTAAFVLGLACVVLASLWLVLDGKNDCLFTATVWVFFAQVLGTAVAAGSTIYRLVWGD